MMKTKIPLGLALVLFAVTNLPAQTPAPVVVQPAPAPSPVSAPAAVPAAGEASTQAALKSLGELKAANDEILKKQAATLQQLDELAKAAEQIKIYTKRG